MATSGYTARIAARAILRASFVICVSFAVIPRELDRDDSHLSNGFGSDNRIGDARTLIELRLLVR
jgi:hypothetical protein